MRSYSVDVGDRLTIGFLTRWNATCGVSLHAELLGRELLQRGHQIRVFAPTVESADRWWHHRIIQPDEDFVIRCYEEAEPGAVLRGGSVDAEWILSSDFDVFVVESYISIPYEAVSRILPKIRARVPTVLVVHEGAAEDLRFDQELFDAVVVFDRRYIGEVVEYTERVRIIPYPCCPVHREERPRPPELQGRMLFFSFGRQPVREYTDFLGVLERLSSRYDLLYWIVRSNGLVPVKKRWIVQWAERLSLDKLYEYLWIADVHLLPKGATQKVVVSSTVAQTLGALTPTVAPATRHFEAFPAYDGVKPVLTYRNQEELEQLLVRLVEDREFRQQVVRAAERYVQENSVEVVADAFLKLFDELLSARQIAT